MQTVLSVAIGDLEQKAKELKPGVLSIPSINTAVEIIQKQAEINRLLYSALCKMHADFVAGRS